MDEVKINYTPELFAALLDLYAEVGNNPPPEYVDGRSDGILNAFERVEDLLSKQGVEICWN